MDRQQPTNAPLVSVIVLTYNQESTVSLTLDSILAQQTDISYEIIIGDDDSTDSTRAVCEEYARRHPDTIRLMPRAPRKGLVGNYLDCLAACRGRYIADCAGDDTWEGTDRISSHVALLESHPECAAAAGDWIEGGVVKTAADRPSASDFIAAGLTLPDVLSAATYRADLVRPHIAGLRSQAFPCEDLPIFMLLLAAGDIVRVPGAALRYRDDEGTVSRPRSVADSLSYHSRVIDMRLRLIESYGLRREDFATPMSRRLDHLTRLTFRHGAGLDTLRALTERFGAYRPSALSRLRRCIMNAPRLWRLSRGILSALKPE